MAYVLTDESNYEAIAEAIREMNGTSDTYTPSEMADAIRGIETGGKVTGVKGNAESSYRTGDVNLTPENIGAASAADVTKVNYGLGTAIPLKSELEYPIKKGTHAFHGPSRSYEIYMANRDIADAEDDTSSAWTGPRTVASAYAGNVDLALKSLIAALAAAEAKAIEAFPTDTVEGETVRITDAVKAPVKALTVTMRPIQSGSGDPSAANPRAISGRTSVTVTHRRKNAANIPDNTYTNSGVVFTVSGGTVRMTGTSTGTINRTIGTAQLLGGVTYTISGSRSSGIYDSEALRIDLRNTYGSVIASGDSYFGFTYTPTTDTTVSINIRVASGQTLDTTIYPQVEPGETATNFEPYEVDTLSVEWTDEAGAICGGTLNLVTGELLADWVLFETTWGEGTDVTVGDDVTNKTFTLPRVYSPLTQDQSAAICNLCSWSNSLYRFTTPAFRLALKPSGGNVTTIATVALLNDTADDQVVQIAYKAQKPFALYQLDPLAAPIITSQGGNEFESDADSVAVTYRADPTRYIARKIAEATA